MAVTLEDLALFCLGLVRLGLSGLDGLDLVGLSHLGLAMAALGCPGGLGHGCFGFEGL